MKENNPTHYVAGEGREYMHTCVKLALDACAELELEKLVVFTGTGEGAQFAAKEVLSKPDYSKVQVVAVTPPFGRPYFSVIGDTNSPLVYAGVNPAMRDELERLGMTVVAAHLPFKEMYNGRDRTSEWTRVAEAYGVLGGGFALCIQAILVACDAGAVFGGERIVVASADTAFIAIASRTETFLSPLEGLIVEHIICRPARYPISKKHHYMWAPPPPPPPPLTGVAAPPELPSGSKPKRKKRSQAK